MKLKKVLVAYTKPKTKEDKLTFDVVKKVLNKLKIKYSFIQRMGLKEKDFKKKDLTISVGGDGTFLQTAQFIKDKTPIFGVNSDVNMKEGFFLEANRNDFEDKITKIIKDKFRMRSLARLEASINDKKVPDLALNEFYIGSDKEYITSRYYIKIGEMEERQKSSGVLIATPAGSYAWIKSCGGKKLKITARKFEYLIREPYKGKVNGKYKLKKGILKEDKEIIITSDMNKGFFVADSLGKEYFFNKRDKIKVGISDKDLNVVFF